jgi:hypothetical protein
MVAYMYAAPTIIERQKTIYVNGHMLCYGHYTTYIRCSDALHYYSDL